MASVPARQRQARVQALSLDTLTQRLSERIDETADLRRLPDASIQDMKDAGVFRVLQPARWGGQEATPNTFFDTQRAIARACASHGWVYGVVGVHAWQLALFPLEAQEEVWGDDPDTLISSSYAPTGKVEKVDGGYRLTGRWSFSSGCDHCDWVFVGGFAPSDGPPDMRTFLVPRRDYTIDDTWHTFALRGTGSKDVVMDSVFVPEHRTHKFSDGFRCKSPGNAHNPAPLYRLPFGQIFVRSVSTTALGITEAALAFYRSVTGTKVGASDGSKAAEDPLAQMTCTRAATAIDRNLLVLTRNMNELMDAAEQGEVLSVERRAAMRWDSAQAVEASVDAVDRMFTACGGRALFTNSPMYRWFCDVHGARAHYANRPEGPGRNYGRVLLGNKTRDWFI